MFFQLSQVRTNTLQLLYCIDYQKHSDKFPNIQHPNFLQNILNTKL